MKLKPLQLACTSLVLSLFITGSAQAASKIRAQSFAGTYSITSPSSPELENRLLIISNGIVGSSDGAGDIVPPGYQLFFYTLKDPNNNDSQIGQKNIGYYTGNGRFTFTESDPARQRNYAIKINLKTGKGKGSQLIANERNCTDLSNDPNFGPGNYFCVNREEPSLNFSKDYTIEKISNEIL